MPVETERHAMPHDIGLQTCHQNFIMEHVRQMVYVMKLHAYAQISHTTLHRHYVSRVVILYHGQRSSHVGAQTGRDVQVVPRRIIKVSIVSTSYAVKPGSVILRELFRPSVGGNNGCVCGNSQNKPLQNMQTTSPWPQRNSQDTGADVSCS